MMIKLADIYKDGVQPIAAAIANTQPQSESKADTMMNCYNKTSYINGPINYSSINVNIR